MGEVCDPHLIEQGQGLGLPLPGRQLPRGRSLRKLSLAKATRTFSKAVRERKGWTIWKVLARPS